MEETERIRKLNEEIDVWKDKLRIFAEKLEAIKNKSSISQENFWHKEKELSELREKLDTFQTEEVVIQKQIENKVQELNQSNLSKEEKNQKIVEIMTGENQQLKVSRKNISQMWKSMSQSKDSLLEIKDSLSNSRLKSIESLERTKHGLWITVWVLLGVVVFLSLSLCYHTKKQR